MNYHKNKRILVGVTGGIAAFKAPDLVRRLKERGADVRVVMSDAAREFVTPLTLQAVSGHPVHKHLLDADAESGMGHIELARWAETIVVAPATANFIAKMTSGRADDLLSTLVLATSAEVVIAPAMNQQMWQHPSTAANLDVLASRGVRVIGPASGDQACGEVGPGRMTEPDEIAGLVAGDAIPQLLQGQSVLLTAGPTWEAIDPVRGITNHSSGKMGYALASAAADFGANVQIVSGPVSLSTPEGCQRTDVQSAQQMLEAVMEKIAQVDMFIAVAAVADFRPEQFVSQKIKKQDDTESMTLALVKNPDILASVASLANPPFTIGFAAETDNVIANARNKLENKRVDVIAANHVGEDAGVFGGDENSVTLVHRGGEHEIPAGDKYAVAIKMLSYIQENLR